MSLRTIAAKAVKKARRRSQQDSTKWIDSGKIAVSLAVRNGYNLSDDQRERLRLYARKLANKVSQNRDTMSDEDLHQLHSRDGGSRVAYRESAYMWS